MTTKTQATVEDLYHLPENGKAEIVNEALVRMAPSGYLPNYAAGEIFVSLRDHSRRTKSGYALSDNAGFIVDLSDRRSFSPDAAWYTGKPAGMKFLEGAPVFAVEVRSDTGYGPRAEQQIRKKRQDYFAAGTLCVWDVDLLGPDVIKAYFANDPDNPIIFRRGEMADAGEAVPGWSLAVDDLFPEEQE
ncbi:MAG TPA: Uma2 family endonuclease [Blastocatellia bacterium]|nr:Uma2 family endonuclease [Blastocatellia bacterium]